MSLQDKIKNAKDTSWPLVTPKKEMLTYLDGFADGLNMANNSTNKMLDKIKAEILDNAFSVVNPHNTYEYINAIDLNSIDKILDKHKVETEADNVIDTIAIRKWNPTMENDLYHCQYTDEEIAKSFIEDVEAVKDLLPTTKVERQIKEICVSYPKSDLKEHDGQPYYSVKYIENGEEYEGYGTYKIEVFMEYLKNYFMPSITQQKP